MQLQLTPISQNKPHMFEKNTNKPFRIIVSGFEHKQPYSFYLKLK